MRTTSLTDFRRNLATAIDRVTDDHEPMLITRGTGKSPAVLMSLEDFASYEETRHLLQNPKNAKRLVKAITELENGEGLEKTLADEETAS